MIEYRARVLSCEFRISGQDDEVARALAGLPFHAVQAFEPTRHHHLEVVRADDGYRVREDGRASAHVPDGAALARHVQQRVQTLALAALDGYAKLHAGSASLRGRGVLFAGPERSGKTTLMTRLLYEGFEVQGDDTVILRDGRAIAFPRRFGLRRGTLALLPQLAARTPPWAADGPPDGYHVLALDPTELGFPWRISPVPVDAVFFLEPAHRSPSRARPCPRYEMARHLMSQSIGPVGGPRPWIREIATLVARAECVLLELGELDSAVRAVHDVLSSIPPVPAGGGTAGTGG